jgi:hypothetical protein
MPPTVSPTPPPAPAVEATSAVPGIVQAIIVEPADGGRVSGPVPVIGIAAGPGFASYQLEYAEGLNPAVEGWNPLGEKQSKPQPGGVLGVWPTGSLAPGPYVLRLQVIDISSGTHTAQVLVEVLAAP